MPGPWFRPIPTPGQIRPVTDVSTFSAALAASNSGDRIQMAAGTYAMNIAPTVPNLQIFGTGHVIINGFIYPSGGGQWYNNLHHTNPSGVPGSAGMQINADDVSVINCIIHDFPDSGSGPGTGSPNAIFNASGFGGTLLYGNAIYDARHILYYQNHLLEARKWAAHNYIADVNAHIDLGDFSNSYNIHQYSSQTANVNNISYHENIVARGMSLCGADGGSDNIIRGNEFVGNYFFQSGLVMYGRPAEIVIKNNYFNGTFADFVGTGVGQILNLGQWHGTGEVSFGYHHPSEVTGNLFYKPDSADLFTNLVTCAYTPTRTYTSPGLRAEDIFNNNTYYGVFRVTLGANGLFGSGITDFNLWKSATLNAGNAFDTTSQVIAGAPPNHYKIFQNDYDPDRAMLVVFRHSGVNVSVTLPREGDIYDIEDQWGTPLYTNFTTGNITQNPLFAIIKYDTGGAVPQFARPSNDFNNPGSWVNQAGSGTNIYQSIDEVVADDADFIRSPSAPSAAVYVTKLTSVADPVSSTGHILRYRYNKDTAGGATINLTVQLRQAYVSEGSPGTLIAEITHTNISDAFVTNAYTLSGAEADAITDYANLYLRFSATQV